MAGGGGSGAHAGEGLAFYRGQEERRRGWARHNGGRCSQDEAAAGVQRRRCIVARPSGNDDRKTRACWAWEDLGRGGRSHCRDRGLAGGCCSRFAGRRARRLACPDAAAGIARRVA
jgi:hypothetical protein